jgi:formylglycine-generating enzyme required for sulfatase activity
MIVNISHTLIFAPAMHRILKGFLLLMLVVTVSIAQSQKTAKQHNMVLVVGGRFQMGDDHGYEMEKPVHTVIMKSFYIDKYEVTVKEYQRFCLETHRAMPKKPTWGWHDDFPISNVSWDDATAYAAWAGKRLPTEAEWEFAARGGILSKGYKYSGSDNIDEVAWYDENSKNTVHAVGTKKPNELSLFDMTGNVVEWCADKYDGNYYSVSPKQDPQGPHIGSDRVLRGGSYIGDTDDCRIAKRFSRKLGISLIRFGFRCAMNK